jgi:hypothetical protein
VPTSVKPTAPPSGSSAAASSAAAHAASPAALTAAGLRSSSAMKAALASTHAARARLRVAWAMLAAKMKGRREHSGLPVLSSTETESTRRPSPRAL